MSKPQHPHSKAQLVKAVRAKPALAKTVGNDNSDNSKATSSPQTDAAVLIGLAMAFACQLGSAAVPDVVLNPLNAAAETGCGASRMVMDFLKRRILRANGNTNASAVPNGQYLHLVSADRENVLVCDRSKAHVQI